MTSSPDLNRTATLLPVWVRPFGWFRLRHFQVVLDSWPDAKMRRIVGRKRWLLVLITQDEKSRA